MNAALAIARAQLSGRTPGLAAALALGITPVVIANVYPDFAMAGPSAVTVAWAVSQLVAVLIGMTLFGEDLASGRLAFFFSRPVAGFTVVAAKLGAALAFILALQALLLGPMLLFWPMTWRSSGLNMKMTDFSLTPWQLLICTVLVIGGGAVTAIVGRARTRWLILDAAGATLAVTAIVVGARAIVALARGAGRERLRTIDHRVEALVWICVGGVAVAFLVAACVGLVLGRASPRRVHTATSVTLWATVLPGAGAYLAYIRWLL